MTDQGAGRLAALFDRYPFNSPWVRGLIGRYWLQAWFAIETFLALVQASMDTRYIFFDARLYDAATRAWLSGGDPWQVEVAGNYFAAPPPTLLPLVPFALLPPELGYLAIALVVAVGAIASVWILRLPWWWLLFPPLVQSVISGNVQSLLVPLILVGAGPDRGAAQGLRGRPRWYPRPLAGADRAGRVFLLRSRSCPGRRSSPTSTTIGGRLSSQNENGLPNLVLVGSRRPSHRSLGCGPRTRRVAGRAGDLARPAVLLRHARDADAKRGRGRDRRLSGRRFRRRRAVRRRLPYVAGAASFSIAGCVARRREATPGATSETPPG